MNCPVCKKECSGYTKCPQCGFEEPNKTFLFKTKADTWMKQVVEPYRAKYLVSTDCFAAAKRKMIKTRGQVETQEFYEALARLVKNGTWVYAPTNNNQLIIKSHKGGHYIGIYSDMKGRANEDSKDVTATDINKFIDALYSDPHLTGIVVDPSKDPFWIGRKAIHEVTDRKDPRLGHKDWGPGIPDYTENDLMTKEELNDFGMEIVGEYFVSKHNFEVLEMNTSAKGFPNYALQKDGVLYLVKVDVGVTHKPTPTEAEKAFYLSTCSRFNAQCLYAPVAIVSSNSERAAKELALYGDGFYVNFSGALNLG